MATSTLMKFSLLAFIVILSSYISSTEAQNVCNVANTASSNDMRNAFNCTVQNCVVAHQSCTGPHCFKITILINFIKTVLYPIFHVFVGNCISCPLSLIFAVKAILLVIVFIIAKFLAFLLLSIRTILLFVGIINLCTTQLLTCVTAILGITGASPMIAGMNLFCSTATTSMGTCIP